MSLPIRAVSAIGALALAVSASACSSSKTHSASSSTSSSTAPSTRLPSSSQADFSNLLISATDIPVAGFARQTPTAPPQGRGTTATFTESTGTRTLGDTILVFGSDSEAATAAHASASSASAQITGGQSSSPGIGANSTLVTGT